MTMTIVSAALLLFLILDPLGNVPVVLSLLRPLTPKRQRIVMIRELLIALGVLLVFLWFGKYALDFMHLRQESLSLPGRIGLFLIGLRILITPAEWLIGALPGRAPFLLPIPLPQTET